MKKKSILHYICVIITVATIVMTLSSCGKRIDRIQPPEGVEDPFPHRYPTPLPRPPMR